MTRRILLLAVLAVLGAGCAPFKQMSAARQDPSKDWRNQTPADDAPYQKASQSGEGRQRSFWGHRIGLQALPGNALPAGEDAQAYYDRNKVSQLEHWDAQCQGRPRRDDEWPAYFEASGCTMAARALEGSSAFNKKALGRGFLDLLIGGAVGAGFGAGFYYLMDLGFGALGPAKSDYTRKQEMVTWTIDGAALGAAIGALAGFTDGRTDDDAHGKRTSACRIFNQWLAEGVGVPVGLDGTR